MSVFCEMCKREFKSERSLSRHIRHCKNNTENLSHIEYYLKYINPNCNTFCPMCLKDGRFTKLNFISLREGFCKLCKDCSKRDPEKIEKIKKSLNGKMGFASSEVKEKVKKTMMDKYGEDNPSKIEIFVKKRTETRSAKQDEISKKQSVSLRLTTKERLKKCQATCLEKYGVDNVFKLKEFQEKAKRTRKEKYGVEYVIQNKSFKNKIEKTCIDKYGFKNPSQNKKIIDKVRKTNVDNYMCFFKEQLVDADLELAGVYVNQYELTEFQCIKCGTVFKDTWFNLRARKHKCLVCNPLSISLLEKEVSDFCKQYYPNLIENDRNILGGSELDIYIPDINLAIEFDGLYWHSEITGKKNRSYHINKYLKCKELNIKLIHIFEDEWINKKEIVKSILRSKIHKPEHRVFARKCDVGYVDKKTAIEFLNDNHIQGACGGIHVGLWYDMILVQILSVGKSRYNKKFEWEILRSCSKNNYHIVGGLSKMFKFFQKKENPKSIITYADIRYNDGASYEKLGFEYSHKSDPNYFYIIDNVRESRMKYQKHKLNELLECFDDNLSEWENMKNNFYDRIWDCGNYVFHYELRS